MATSQQSHDKIEPAPLPTDGTKQPSEDRNDDEIEPAALSTGGTKRPSENRNDDEIEPAALPTGGTKQLSENRNDDEIEPAALPTDGTKQNSPSEVVYAAANGNARPPLLNKTGKVTSNPKIPNTVGEGSVKHIPCLHFFVLAAAWIFCVFGCLVISTGTGWPWDLGFQNQLVLIGVLIALMRTCFDEIVGATIVTMEARWGPSTLQRYDAILSKSLLRPQDGWRLWLFSLVLWGLPIGLGAAYKQAIGGELSKGIDLDTGIGSQPYRVYGLFPPTNGSLSTSFGNTPYLLTNATLDFLEASASDDSFPAEEMGNRTAIAYGYNLLLLNNSSAAALDLPHQSYLSAIKNLLKNDESYIIKATVRAFVTQINETVEALRDDDAFWNYVIDLNKGRGFNGMTSFSRFTNATSYGLVPFLPNGDGTLSCLLGSYSNSSTGWTGYYTDANDHEIRAFRNSTGMFTTRRANCSVQWRVTIDSLRLLEGDCSWTTNDTQSVIFSEPHATQFSPYPVDVLPILVHSLQDFADKRADSPWKVPSYTMAVVASYWARGAYMVRSYTSDNDTAVIADTQYSPESESFESSKSTLHAYAWLYFILVLQPFLATVALCLNRILYSTPISNGFGLTSVLAGINTENLGLLHGAGLSGRLREPVTLEISVVQQANRPGVGEGKIEYNLSMDRRDTSQRSKLRRRTFYR